jgi:methionine synthase II (cobalamin-independent)
MGPTNKNKIFAKPASIGIPTEPIGSIPLPVDLLERAAKGDSEDSNLAPLFEDASRDTIKGFVAPGSPVITDGEQRKYHNVDFIEGRLAVKVDPSGHPLNSVIYGHPIFTIYVEVTYAN